MSTNALIGYVENDKYHYVYLHYDGYISYAGKILHEHYDDLEKVKAFVAQGNCSILGMEIGEKISFDDSIPRLEDEIGRPHVQCRFYARDRNEGDNEAGVLDSFEEAREEGFEYVYAMAPTGDWFVSVDGKPLEALSYLL